MILSCQNISKSFGDTVILKNVSFNIEEHDKAAIIGINGAGKTTLLKVILGQLSQNSGNVVTGPRRPPGLSVSAGCRAS